MGKKRSRSKSRSRNKGKKIVTQIIKRGVKGTNQNLIQVQVPGLEVVIETKSINTKIQ